MKHKRLAGLLAFFMAACAMVPTTAFAANSSHTAQFIAEVTTANSKIEPGDTITVTFYMQGASWASMEQGTGFAIWIWKVFRRFPMDWLLLKEI